MKVPAFALLAVVAFTTGCATAPEPPPKIVLDDPVAAEAIPEPPKPVTVVAIPQPLPLPGQLKPMAVMATPPAVPDASSPPGQTAQTSDNARTEVARANDDARMPPTREGYLNAIQVWPYSEGALYQVYASPGRITDVMLQEGEELTSVSAGDTVRWIVGDTTSASGAAQRVHVLVKPVRANLKTNLIISTSRRIYLLELTATEATWMASVSWDYPRDQLTMLKTQAQHAEAAAPVAEGIALDRLAFRYDVSGDTPSWRPLRAFDDGERVYIQFPAGIAQGELPPLFVVGAGGDAELVSYRYRAPYYIVDRLFGAAELRLGGDKAQVVRISRTDGIKRASGL
jgi:type IV secretion system protein VirB9